MRRAATLAERLDRHSTPEPNTGCRLWTGAQSGSRGSYGHLKVAGRFVKAHRVSWAEANGPIPDGMEVDHRCGQTLCIEPAHLQLATPYENKMRSNGMGARNARKRAA